jgi:trigger factor
MVEGRAIEELAPKAAGLGKGKDFWMIADNENSFLPGFAEGLVGANVGEKRQVFVDFPADFPEAAVAGKKATYFTDVKGVREKKPAQLDESFLKSLAVDSEQTLRSRVKADLQRMREGAEKRRQTGEMIQFLLKNTALDVPESVLAQETRNEVYDIVQQTTYSGASKEEIEGRKEEIFDAATRTATERVKLRYILRRIAGLEKVEVQKGELDGRIALLAQQRGVPADKLRADLEERRTLGRIEEEIRLNKTLDLLLEQAKLTIQ